MHSVHLRMLRMRRQASDHDQQNTTHTKANSCALWRKDIQLRSAPCKQVDKVADAVLLALPHEALRLVICDNPVHILILVHVAPEPQLVRHEPEHAVLRQVEHAVEHLDGLACGRGSLVAREQRVNLRDCGVALCHRAERRLRAHLAVSRQPRPHRQLSTICSSRSAGKLSRMRIHMLLASLQCHTEA
jgi:hypothetical protein